MPGLRASHLAGSFWNYEICRYLLFCEVRRDGELKRWGSLNARHVLLMLNGLSKINKHVTTLFLKFK